jgi:hypothetical protein
MFTLEDRNRVRDHVLALAESDHRVVAGAVVGSLALDEGDRWSDLDLTFAVADGTPLADVLDDWTRDLSSRVDAVHLFDLPAGPSIYRVFVLPACLQVDLSFTPASQFAATGPKFKLLFGRAAERALPAPPAGELFGYAVHHALRARVCIERGRFWHGEYWISGVRDYALSLACHRRGLPTSYGRGFDDLPDEVQDRFRSALVRSLDRAELLRALKEAIDGLLSETQDVQTLAESVAGQLRALTMSWEPMSEVAQDG